VLGRLLDARGTLYVASLCSLSLGLFFTFVWAPHPWTWAGIDQYHDLARAVARGEGFNTTDVPWGYTYYVAIFYVLFGEHAWLPIVGQVIANAAMPIMLHAIVLPLAGARTATLAAVITGVFSFNTVYASTQMSDAICSPLFLAAVLCFVRAHLSGSTVLFGACGLLAGLSTQFRPNLLLLPGLAAVGYWWMSRGRAAQAAAFLAMSVLVMVPWTVRNYRLTGELLPTSSHGAVQLWYGSLQIGPYLEDRTANPRSALEHAPFPYTSLIDTPIVVTMDPSACSADVRGRIALIYWTTRQESPMQVRPTDQGPAMLEFHIPGQPDHTVVSWRVAPSSFDARPGAYLVSTDHLGAIDQDMSRADSTPTRTPNVPDCLIGRVQFNEVFYRRELHMMRRYAALAMDNIRREPLAFAAASAYRAVRLFVIRPAATASGATYRFAGASVVYAAGLLLSVAYLIVFLSGVVVAWRRRRPLLALLLPIVYVPVTICMVLTNQRYTVTVQPLMFAFMALAIVTAFGWELSGKAKDEIRNNE